jgi:tetratricopeptide (TPR) repeat protein
VPAEAARCRFWLAFSLMMRGQMAPAVGWLGRAQDLIDEHDLDCAAAGYVMVPAVLMALESGDPQAARDMAIRAGEIGARFDDPDLQAFGTLGHGQALIAMGDAVAGTAQLDDVMVSVTAGEVGPIVSGVVYCAVVLTCLGIFDLRRAAEWTAALSAWCDDQPDLVPYRGQCLVHRSQIAQASGDWPDAITTIEQACARLTEPPHPALGLAYYQEAELHRLLGDLDEAERGYRRASGRGHEPMPGLALLQVARGEVDAAVASVRRALAESGDPVGRPALLSAAVEVLLAAGDVEAAHGVAEELATVAAGSPSPVLEAMAAHAASAVLLDRGEPRDALAGLRHAASIWRSLQMPYDGARTAVLVARACAGLGDRAGAALELDNAADAFDRLGARPDRDRLDRLRAELLAAPGPPADEVTLSARECEVLVHVAGWGHEPSDRGGAGDQSAHRRPPPREHLRQARCVEPGCGDGVGLRARPALTRWGVRPTDRAARDGVYGRCGVGSAVRMVDEADSPDHRPSAVQPPAERTVR